MMAKAGVALVMVNLKLTRFTMTRSSIIGNEAATDTITATDSNPISEECQTWQIIHHRFACRKDFNGYFLYPQARRYTPKSRFCNGRLNPKTSSFTCRVIIFSPYLTTVSFDYVF